MTKPSKAAMRAANAAHLHRCPYDTHDGWCVNDIAILAAIIDRETGTAELVESAQCLADALERMRSGSQEHPNTQAVLIAFGGTRGFMEAWGRLRAALAKHKGFRG